MNQREFANGNTKSEETRNGREKECLTPMGGKLKLN
jgi:hypothetical protein